MPAPRQERESEMEALNAKSVTCMSVMERLGGAHATDRHAGTSPRDECRNQHKNLNKHTEYTPVTLCPDRTSSRPPKHAASRFPTRGAVRSCDAPIQYGPDPLLRCSHRDIDAPARRRSDHTNRGKARDLVTLLGGGAFPFRTV